MKKQVLLIGCCYSRDNYGSIVVPADISWEEIKKASLEIQEKTNGSYFLSAEGEAVECSTLDEAIAVAEKRYKE